MFDAILSYLNRCRWRMVHNCNLSGREYPRRRIIYERMQWEIYLHSLLNNPVVEDVLSENNVIITEEDEDIIIRIPIKKLEKETRKITKELKDNEEFMYDVDSDKVF